MEPCGQSKEVNQRQVERVLLNVDPKGIQERGYPLKLQCYHKWRRYIRDVFKVWEIRKDRQALVSTHSQSIKTQEVFLTILSSYSLPQEGDHAGIRRWNIGVQKGEIDRDKF